MLDFGRGSGMLSVVMRTLDNPTPDLDGADAVSAQSGPGRASFRRLGPGAIVLDVEYRAEGGTVELPDGNLQAGVAALCEREIGAMRHTLAGLGEELAAQLSDDGRAAVIRREWDEEWSRSWRDDRTAFTVRGATTRAREMMTGYEGASDAGLVRGTVMLMIEQRERNIREMYGKILTDAEAKRV